MPLFVWIKEEVKTWCKHQAKTHHHTRMRVVCGWARRVLKRMMCPVCVISQPSTSL